MKDDIAIEVKDLHKSFILPHEKISSVKSVFTNFGIVKNRKYEKQHALKGVSFTVKKGEFFGIVGRNGSGKSTLLKLLAGIYQPTKGSIQTNGKIVPFIELGVGFNPDLSGRDNVYLNGAMLGFSDQQVDEKYKAIVDFAELERFMDQKLKNYSSGMQVRLAFSVATILAESDILLLDEVLAVGDADFQRKCFNYFRTLKKTGKTVIFISHDMNSIREYCDNALLINDGIVTSEGSSTKVSNEYTKLFIKNNKLAGKSSDQSVARSGSGAVQIGGYKQKIIINDKAEQIVLRFIVSVNQDLDTLAVGFRLKSSDDKHLFGTNNIIKQQRLENLKKGQKLNFVYQFSNILNNGTYHVDLAAESADGEVFDWIFDAMTIESVTEKMTGYLIDPNVDLEINHEYK